MIPLNEAGTRLCISVNENGVSVYGNKPAFKSLAAWMSRLAESAETDHFECHVVMSLEDEESKFEGKTPKNVSVLMDKKIADSFAKRTESNTGFELTFMAVENQDLEHLAQFQKIGLLPDEEEPDSK
jgi:hypothetical protein